MIVSIGEILADMIGETKDGTPVFSAFAGGAPFNVAASAKRCGAKTGFIGKVGKDVVGDFLQSFTKKLGLDYLKLLRDDERNTTLAFVALDEQGERAFTFFRHETADYNLDFQELNLEKLEGLSIVHLGSLMLSESKGQRFVKDAVKWIKANSKLFSFDVNFRLDLYKDVDEAIEAYKWCVERADILKFSDDEILAYTREKELDDAIEKLVKNGRLLVITLGKRGSMFCFGREKYLVPTVEVTPVDTTGAGDAFYGALLAKIDEIGYGNLKSSNLIPAFEYANSIGAECTLHKGAIQL